MLDEASLADWCDRYLGARPACVLLRSGHLSQVIAAELADGRRVVIKARPRVRRPRRLGIPEHPLVSRPTSGRARLG